MKTQKAEPDSTGTSNAWDQNEYARRKAERSKSKPAEWVVNPETGERFYLRRVGALGLTMSGQISHALTDRAVESWKNDGLDVGESQEDGPAADIEDARREAQKNIEFATRVALEACVIPKLGKGEGEVDPALLDDEDLLFIVDYATRPAGALPTRGGGAVSVDSLQTFRKKPGRRSRVSANG